MVHKSRMGVMVIDCKMQDLEEASQFWSDALGFEARRDPEHPDYVELVTPENHIKVLLQSVSHDPRIHMDIETDDRDAERERLLKLGAKIVNEVDEGTKHWTVMEAPTGHRFCLVKPQSDAFHAAANEWEIA